ncbi:hypothetical protein BC834DRAFT_970491 [Gloeopeniophorella convolvens]|nr:hypothetical protein BC834DRAFT_970491 [Gloeopeniophorella convolvens]
MNVVFPSTSSTPFCDKITAHTPQMDAGASPTPESTSVDSSTTAMPPFALMIRSRRKARDAIQIEVDAIQEQADTAGSRLRTLYTELNALVIISLLPAELLAHIFCLIRDDEHSIIYASSTCWITVTHVCRLWREVALGDASLWSRIGCCPFLKEPFTEMFARSKGTLVDVFHVCSRPSTQYLHELSRHASRIRELCLHGLETPTLCENAQAVLSLSAPNLESLDLSMDTSDTVFSVLPQHEFRLTRGVKLFNGHAPKLREIFLDNLLIPWACFPSLMALTRLEVNSSSPEGSSFPATGTLPDLADFLRSCPALVELVLKKCFPLTSSRLSRREDTIVLPYLHQLDLRGPTHSVLYLLMFLKTPSLRFLRSYCIAKHVAEASSWSQIIPAALSCHESEDSTVVFRSLKLKFDPEQKWPVTEVRVLGDRHESVPGGQPNVNITVLLEFQDRTDAGSIEPHDIFHRVCTTLHVANLKDLSVDFSSMNRPPQWADPFEQCINITTLKISGRGAVPLLGGLSPRRSVVRSRVDSAESSSPARDAEEETLGSASAQLQPASSIFVDEHALLFPNLVSLTLCDLDFGERVNGSSKTTYDLVAWVLQRRKHRGALIQSLSIQDCDIKSGDADALKELVPEFLWDGRQGTYSEYSDDSSVVDSDDVDEEATAEVDG